MTYTIPAPLQTMFIIDPVVEQSPPPVWYPCSACYGCGGRMHEDTGGSRWVDCWYCGGKGGHFSP